MAIIFSISNQKGGVGKTTTAINLSASLAALEKTCLLVDCDPQGNATTGLGFSRDEVESGLYDIVMGHCPPQDAVLETPLKGLHLIGATADLLGIEVELSAAGQKELRLSRGLAPLRKAYDYVFLDCPPSLGQLTVNSLSAADAVLVPLQCEYYALEGLSQILRSVKAVQRSLNPTLRMAGILLTMFDRRNNLSSQVAEDVRSHFKERVFQTVIPRNVRLSEAPSYGKPILLYDIRSAGAQSYLSLAQELMGRVTSRE